MDRLTLDLRTFDVGVSAATPEAFADHVIGLVRESWSEGADVVVLPEFLWMGLEKFVAEPDKVRGVARLFWERLWPRVVGALGADGKAAVLGTVPFAGTDGLVRNRAPILNGGTALHQDKLHLTPWEGAFSSGDAVRVWEFRGVRFAVVICLDIEVPEISAALRGAGVDVLLVPSATETLLGVERVGRCADARAVELGCYVGLCHLVGRTQSQLIDENVGRLGFFTPSQTPFLPLARQRVTPVVGEGLRRLTVGLDLAALRRNRATVGETDPSRLKTRGIRLDP